MSCLAKSRVGSWDSGWWRLLGRAGLCCFCGVQLLPYALLGGLGKRRPIEGSGSGGARSPQERWRMSRAELRELLNRYESAVEADADGLLHPSTSERALLGEELLLRRASAVRRAREGNRRFVEALLDDLPADQTGGSWISASGLLRGGPAATDTPESSPCGAPSRPIAGIRCLSESDSTLPSSSYGSLASVFLHLFRDWSASCEHVGSSQYGPVVAELCKIIPEGGEVLVPGAGLGRLALMLASEGFKVEANDASRLFLTVADFILNRTPESGLVLFPLAHVFTENWRHDEQYLDICVPVPSPVSLLSGRGELSGESPIISLVPGDFVKLYAPGRPGHRRFDAIVTCFFIDTATDVAELFGVIDSLLGEGGVWINLGPLNWRKEARMKLCWDEVVAMWTNLGYEFVSRKAIDCDYHLQRGLKMYTESYQCSLTAAVKRLRNKQ